jgi:hypothetical protein
MFVSKYLPAAVHDKHSKYRVLSVGVVYVVCVDGIVDAGNRGNRVLDVVVVELVIDVGVIVVGVIVVGVIVVGVIVVGVIVVGVIDVGAIVVAVIVVGVIVIGVIVAVKMVRGFVAMGGGGGIAMEVSGLLYTGVGVGGVMIIGTISLFESDTG